MSENVVVILNVCAGSAAEGSPQDDLRDAFRANDIAAEFLCASGGDEIQKFAKDAAAGPAGVIVAAGGDGTVSTVASELVNTSKKLGVLPLGTLNNFSKDLQIPQDVAESVKVIADGFTQKIDVGEVNGRFFINNSSIGLYPHIVRKRERHQRLGHGKWWAAAWAAWRFLWVSPFLKVKLKLDGNEFLRKTPFVFVGNNDYEMDFYNIGRCSRLDEGKLSIYLLHRSGRTGLFLLILRTLFGRLKQAKDFEEIRTTDVTINTRRKRIHVACDGEVETMNTPLQYRIHPRALRVIVPRPE